MTKISVILPTFRVNTKEELDELHNYGNHLNDNPLGNEFSELYNKHTSKCKHILELTINALENQTFKDFELLLCHKYPEDVYNIREDYTLPITLIKEKDSVWHSLGNYPTVNNIRNTGIMNATGELLFFLDDMCIFNENLLQKVWNNYINNYYTTCKVFKRITIVDGKLRGSEKFVGGSEGTGIPNYSTWTYGMSVSKDECLAINGFDEIYDGSFGGTDLDFGRRLNLITQYNRKVGPTIYEFSHSHQKIQHKQIRNDEILRQIFGQSPVPKHTRANAWKPTAMQRYQYKLWHTKNKGELDVNWDKFMNVPLYNLGDS
jgi:hypothetical protein